MNKEYEEAGWKMWLEMFKDHENEEKQKLMSNIINNPNYIPTFPSSYNSFLPPSLFPKNLEYLSCIKSKFVYLLTFTFFFYSIIYIYYLQTISKEVEEFLNCYNFFRGVSSQKPYFIGGLRAEPSDFLVVPFAYLKDEEKMLMCVSSRIRQYYELRAASNTYYNRNNKYENKYYVFFVKNCSLLLFAYIYGDMEQVFFLVIIV
jgi:hypothetical protein